MGKSETARLFRICGIPVFDADQAVHRLQGPGGAAIAPIETAFPGTTGPDGVNRQALGRRVFDDPAALRRLERIIHPMVAAEREHFLRHQVRMGRRIAVLDIPLLFEGQATGLCDCTAVASAPAFLQKQRALKRPGMTEEKFRAILARQMPDHQKRRRADRVVPTGLGRRPALAAIRAILGEIRRGQSDQGNPR